MELILYTADCVGKPESLSEKLRDVDHVIILSLIHI